MTRRTVTFAAKHRFEHLLFERPGPVIHLDTSFLIQAVRGEPHEAGRLRAWLPRNEDVAISAIAWAEFLCGPVSEEANRNAAAMLGEAGATLATSKPKDFERMPGVTLG